MSGVPLRVIEDARMPRGTALVIPAGETLDSVVRTYTTGSTTERLELTRRTSVVRLRAEPVERPEPAVRLDAHDDALARGEALSPWLCPACGWWAPWPLHWLSRALGLCPWWCSA